MTSSEPKDSRALVALTALLRLGAANPSEAELARGLYLVRTRLTQRESLWRVKLGWSLIVASVLACVALGVDFWRRPRAQSSVVIEPVAVARVEGGKIVEGGYLAESGRAGISLQFSEGTEFRLAPGARGRLRSVHVDGARFALEHGDASFRITHNPDHKWSVEAGPFLVTVRGTDFSVSWDPRSEQFGVKLRQGRVVVSGPVLGDDLVLRPGQNLSVNLPAAETVISEARTEALPEKPDEQLRPPPAADAAAPLTKANQKAKPASSIAASRAEASAPTSERRWAHALAGGQWDRILADVERDGLDATLQSASSEELVALADAARYRRRADWARAALLTQRRRFPNSGRALDAIFLLGRVEELRANAGTAAIGWYDQYLAQAPNGTYAAEALGRKMILSNATGGPSAARPIADEYLRRFPRGSYAGAARALQRGR
ncbi:MAG: FecR domain-containing protein [Myxococcota bacterium]